MKLFIPKDYFNGNPIPPRAFLCNTADKRIGELQISDLQGTFKWNSYSQIDFVAHRVYTDVLTGDTVVDPLFDKIETPRTVFLEDMGFFIIQDVDTSYGEKDEVQVSCFSKEYSAAQKYLNLFVINKGTEESKEVIYAADQYGSNAKIEDMYKLANEKLYDANEKYFHRVYEDSRNYTYTQIQIDNEADYLKHFGEDMHPEDVLYIRGWAPVTFYDPNTPELSLLHLIFSELAEWKIGHVDYSLRDMVRSFQEDRVAIYDFVVEKVCDTFKCICEWDTINMEVNFYEEVEDGLNEDGTVATKWDTDVFISRDNLASQIDVKYSADEIKTKLKVAGSDDLDIREVNLGKNYIMNLDYYHTHDWMEQDLFEAYDDYLEAVKEYTPKYTEASQGRVAAYNKWNDLMNAVPAENNVVLVGDPFEKLYCMYTPINTAYLPNTLYNSDIDNVFDNIYMDKDCTEVVDKTMLSDGEDFVIQGYLFRYSLSNTNFKCESNETQTTNFNALIEMLNLYHVDDDIDASVNDNILLKLKNSKSDIATIRIYDPKQLDKVGRYNRSAYYYIYDDSSKEKYIDITLDIAIEDDAEGVYKQFYKDYADRMYINDYQIQVVIVDSVNGISTAPKCYTMSEWISGKLTAEYMDLADYTVQHIGTMGAYLVLAKDEKEEANIQDYGVNLLKEKHNTYTKIFQTQTEAMFSQEKYQVIASDEQPSKKLVEGTVWYDTDSTPAQWYMFTGGQWATYTGDLSERENYIRYQNNYDKLKVVQKVLIEKEKEATYMCDGVAISDEVIDTRLYTKGSDGALRYKGQTLEGNMSRLAEAHFLGTKAYLNIELTDAHIGKVFDKIYSDTNCYVPIDKTNLYDGYRFVVQGYALIYDKTDNNFVCDDGSFHLTKINMDQDTPIYTFAATKYPDQAFAVYLKGTTPYIAYANSQGVYQAQMDWIARETDLENFFTEDQWIRLSPFIREDEFSDSNFLLTGYESEEERLEIYGELKEAAAKELKTLCQPRLEFSMNMANILALPEFASLVDQFQLGNFIRVHIRDGYVKRARLLEVGLNFSDISDFNCSFGNLVSVKTEIDKHAELLSQAVQAGKTVAQSAGNWQKAVDKSNTIEQEIANGLANATLEVGRASNQSIVWNENGIWCRRKLDGTTDQYDDEQIKIINNKILYSSDGFRTSKSAFGSFVYDGQKYSGVLADALIGGIVNGATIVGGNLKIGDGSQNYFQVNEKGEVSIISAGKEKYASVDAVQEIDNAYRFHITLSYDKSTVFSDIEQNCTMTCKVYDYGTDITDQVISIGGKFSWIRTSANTEKDEQWNSENIKTGANANKIVLDIDDVLGNSHFSCSVDFDENKISS